MNKDKHTKLHKKEKFSEEFLTAVKEKDVLKMIRVKKKIDDVNKKPKNK